MVLYPALNVVSSYPLNAITLGDAIMATYKQYLPGPFSKTQKVLCRLVAAVPPLVGAACVSDISKITSVTGVFGIATCDARCRKF